MPVSSLSKGFMPDPKTMTLGTYIGFVKANEDAQRMGRLAVYIPEFGGDPTDPSSWVTVAYAAPFAGATDPSLIQENSQAMAGSQQSYGFWMVPPDLNNEVAVFFANNDISRGYWFACCYQTNMNHMVPGAAVNVTTEVPPGIAPVVEYNKANVGHVNNPQRPRFDPLADALLVEGLSSDAERGTSSTSARRESPSKVFGFNSPRTNTMHIDDDPANEFIRLRTRSGTQVLVNETSGFVYINSKNGNSWMEVSDAGVDVYTNCSVSMRSELDFNVRADRDIVFDAGANIFMRAASKIAMQAGTEIDQIAGTNILLQSGTDTHIGVGANLVVSAVGDGTLKIGGDWQAKAGKNYRMMSGADMTQKAKGKQIRAGTTIYDNCNGAPGVTAHDAAVPVTRAGLMLNDSKPAFATPETDKMIWKGAGSQVNTIVGRMPTHEPWHDHPHGDVPPPPTVDIEIVDGGVASFPSSEGLADNTEGNTFNPNNPDGSVVDSGCQIAGKAGTEPIPSDVFNAITAAASKTGCDPAIMFAFADMESKFHANITAGTSTASGLFQFTSGTWQAMVKKYGAKYNVAYGSIHDPQSNALMGGQFIQDNATILKKNGLNPTPGHLYIMHFLGSGGGPKLIKAAQTTPDADAALVFPTAAGANRRIFAGKTVSVVCANLSRMADTKAQAYAGQYGLTAPCDRGTSGTPAIGLQAGNGPPAQGLAGPPKSPSSTGTAPPGSDGTTQPPPAAPPLPGKLASVKAPAAIPKGPGGWSGKDHQCVSLVYAAGVPGPAKDVWKKGSSDPTTWAPNQPIAIFDSNGHYGNHVNFTSHAAIFLGIVDSGGHGRFDGKPEIRVWDQWDAGALQPAHERIIHTRPTPKLVDYAPSYSAINL